MIHHYSELNSASPQKNDMCIENFRPVTLFVIRVFADVVKMRF